MCWYVCVCVTRMKICNFAHELTIHLPTPASSKGGRVKGKPPKARLQQLQRPLLARAPSSQFPTAAAGARSNNLARPAPIRQEHGANVLRRQRFGCLWAAVFAALFTGGAFLRSGSCLHWHSVWELHVLVGRHLFFTDAPSRCGEGVSCTLGLVRGQRTVTACYTCHLSRRQLGLNVLFEFGLRPGRSTRLSRMWGMYVCRRS